MTLNALWTIVERVNAAAIGEMPTKCRLLADELRRLPSLGAIVVGPHLGPSWSDHNKVLG